MRSLVVLALCVGVAAATPVPSGFKIWPSSISPDGKLGVIVPDVDHLKDNELAHFANSARTTVEARKNQVTSIVVAVVVNAPLRLSPLASPLLPTV